MTVRVFTTGVFDLFHTGHLRALIKAKSHGDYLLVGVCNDEETRDYKRLPIIPLEQRLEIVRAIDCVDEAFESPVYTTEKFYRENEIDIHCQGDPILDHYTVGEKLGILRNTGRDPEVDTTMLIKRILGRDK